MQQEARADCHKVYIWGKNKKYVVESECWQTAGSTMEGLPLEGE